MPQGKANIDILETALIIRKFYFLIINILIYIFILSNIRQILENLRLMMYD